MNGLHKLFRFLLRESRRSQRKKRKHGDVDGTVFTAVNQTVSIDGTAVCRSR